MNISPNILSVGDIVEVSLYQEWERESSIFKARIKAFKHGLNLLYVEALEISDDPFVENYFTVPFNCVRRLSQ